MTFIERTDLETKQLEVQQVEQQTFTEEFRISRLLEALKQLLEPFVSASLCYDIQGIADNVKELPAEEQSCILHSVPKRRAEFSTGRRLAHEQILKLKQINSSLLPDKDRVVQWPAGITGSISHASYEKSDPLPPLCAAIVGKTPPLLSIGIDIETRRKLPKEIQDHFLSEADRKRLDAFGDPNRIALWGMAAKEAAYKWHFPLFRTFYDFPDVPILKVIPGSQHLWLQTQLKNEKPWVALLETPSDVLTLCFSGHNIVFEP